MLKRRIVTAKSYIGGDVSQKMLEIARERFPKAKFDYLDIFNLPYPDKSQPNVICIHVLQHLPHYAEAVKELIRITSRRLYIASWFNESFEDNIVFGETEWGASFYNNCYSLPKFLAFLYGNADAAIKSVCVKHLAKHLAEPSYNISLTLK
jgi:ubiquinone/menaquinone biosynthesis C-methylase UbiE